MSTIERVSIPVFLAAAIACVVPASLPAQELCHSGIAIERAQPKHHEIPELHAGDRIVISVTPLDSNVDLDLELWDSGFHIVASDYSGRSKATIDYTVPSGAKDQSYDIVVKLYSGPATTYTLCGRTYHRR